MKAICDGRKTRNDVVQQNLEQYRAVFNRTQQQINVLKAVSLWHGSVAVDEVLTWSRPSGSTWCRTPIKAEVACTRAQPTCFPLSAEDVARRCGTPRSTRPMVLGLGVGGTVCVYACTYVCLEWVGAVDGKTEGRGGEGMGWEAIGWTRGRG